MAIIQPPKRWAYLVALGPTSIIAGLLLVAAIASGVPAMELAILAVVLNVLAIPAVLIGIWLDTRVVRDKTGIAQRAWVWNLFAVFIAPLVGTVYLYNRRQWFGQVH